MKILVTGSAGHLGEALMRRLPDMGYDPVGLDVLDSRFTNLVGSVTDRDLMRKILIGVEGVIHTATLHKPHIATHSKQDFIDVNVGGTLALVEAAVTAGVSRFVLSSTTSAFGAALRPPTGSPAAWIDETVAPVARNIYGVTKIAAEDICALFARNHGLACINLRLSRFFPEADDNKATRDCFSDANAKANEYLYRRVDIEDAVLAHDCALQCAPEIGFGTYIISAPSPFLKQDLVDLRVDPAGVVGQHFPEFANTYDKAGYRMFADIERVYVSDRARSDLGWTPGYTFARILEQIAAGQPLGSKLAREIGIKGYHSDNFTDGLYPVEQVT